MPAAPAISDELIHSAVNNDYNKKFILGDRVFDLKDLEYDDYVLFIKLSQPIVESIVGVIQPVIMQAKDGKMISDLDLDLSGIDVQVIADLAGYNLPLMTHLCCKQSDPRVTIDDVKKLSMIKNSSGVRGPLQMAEVIMKQVVHNQMIEEFVNFFPRLGGLIDELALSSKKNSTAKETPTS